MPCSLRRLSARLCLVMQVTETHSHLQRNPGLRAMKHTNYLWVHMKPVCLYVGIEYVCMCVVVCRHVHKHVCGEQVCGCTCLWCALCNCKCV